jgi:hypothetical protein
MCLDRPSVEAMRESFRIGDLAKQSGVKVVTIRFYEQSVLLPS